uniref:Uncharacterized protein n=1 Tax=Solanum lycopersicum TaxID=4081 RepID=A0A3Q7F7G4_SOLLC
MLGISYGELFLLLGATAALIAGTAGRFVGRAIGYVQLARGQFESAMQQSQARQLFIRFIRNCKIPWLNWKPYVMKFRQFLL